MPESSALSFPANFSVAELPRLEREFTAAVRAAQGEFVVDLSASEAIDVHGVALLVHLIAETKRRGVVLRFAGISPGLRHKLDAFRLNDSLFVTPEISQLSFAERLGESTFELYKTFRAFGSFQMHVLHYLMVWVLHPPKMRLDNLLRQIKVIGADALPIVALLSFLVGLTLALQSANQLRQFGANIFIVDLVAIGMAREMAPLMTAILLSGRTASAMTSEIAAMIVTEEMDALRGMAIEPHSFVVIPKFIAMELTQPLLTALALVLGILGGFIVALVYLDIPVEAFGNQLMAALQLKDLLTGLFKSLAFAWIISSIGCFKGFRVGKGSEAVGLATTSSVVTSLFAIIIADCIFSFVFYF